MASVNSCDLIHARNALKEVHMTIQMTETLQVVEEGVYHINAAKGLIEAAEKEYEEADFAQAEKLALEAKKQIELAIEISKLYSPVNPP
jgi:hypothetical protein